MNQRLESTKVPASYFFRIKSEIFSDPAHNKKVLNFMGYGHKSRAATENLNLINVTLQASSRENTDLVAGVEDTVITIYKTCPQERKFLEIYKKYISNCIY